MQDPVQVPVATIGTPSPTVGVDNTGKAVQGIRVPFTTAKGAEDSVFIPGTRIDKEAIVNAVRERALALDDLTGHQVT
jgi:hypothetical protein